MIVLLTGTVTPQISQFLSVSDPAVRLHQYALSLRRWTEEGNRRGFQVAMVENSGANLDLLSGAALENVDHGPIMIAAPPPEPSVSERGKGAAEGAMIDYALDLLEVSDPLELLYKCTGRLFVPNFDACAPRRVHSATVVAEVPRGRYTWMDSRLFGATRAVWDSDLRGLGDRVDDRVGVNFENELADRASSLARSSDTTLRVFRAKPWFDGTSGSSGNNYSGDSAQRARRALLDPLHRAHRAIRPTRKS